MGDTTARNGGASDGRLQEAGFTLVELLIVILFLGVLAGIAVFATGPFRTKATNACADANAEMSIIAEAAYDAGVTGAVYAQTPGDCVSSGGSGGPTADWDHRKPVTINAAQVAGDLTSFPVLISVTDTDLRDNAEPSGSDIFFTAADGSTRLPHQIESYDSATGTLVAWVLVDSLSGSSDTEMFVYYGNEGAADQQNANAVWAGYVGVWHLDESPTGAAGEIEDSTSNGNDGFSRGGMNSSDQVTGKIGSALEFDGNNDAVQIPDSASLDVSNLTVSAWVNKQSPAPTWGMIVSRQSGTGSGDLWLLYYRNNTADHYRFYANASANSSVNSNADNGSWVYMTGTYDGSTARLYRNGTEIATGGGSGGLSETSAVCIAAGANDSSRDCTSELINARVDEVRVSDVARSPAWIQTEYSNQNSPGSFHTFGSQEDL